MGKLKFALGNLWFWASIFLAWFFTENVAVFTNNPTSGFDLTTFVLLSSVIVITMFMFYFLEHKKNHMTLDFVMLPAIAIITITSILAIWFNKGAQSFAYANGSGEVIVYLSNNEKIYYTILTVITMSATYMLTMPFYKHKPHSKMLFWFTLGFLIYTYVSIIFSFILEGNLYKEYFIDSTFKKSIQSFYTNPNIFGAGLLMGILSCFILNYYKHNAFFYISIFIIFIFLIFTTSVTSILIASIAIILYLVVEIIMAFRKKMVFGLISLCSFIICILGIMIMFYICLDKQVAFFVNFKDMVKKHILTKDFSTFTNRVSIWQAAIKALNESPTHLLFGYGPYASQKYIQGFTSALNNGAQGVNSCHNGYVEIALRCGIIGLVFYAGIIIYFLYSCIHLLTKKKVYFVWLYFLCFISLCVHNTMEVTLFFDFGIKETTMTIVFFMPVIVANKHLLHKGKKTEMQNSLIWRPNDNPHIITKTIVTVLLSFIISIGVLFTYQVTNTYRSISVNLINVIIGLSIALLFVPYLVSLMLRNTSKKMGVLQIAVHVISYIGILFPVVMCFTCIPALKPHGFYVIPSTFAGLLLLETIIYSLIKHGSIKEYFFDMIGGLFKVNFLAIIFSGIVGVGASLFVQYLTTVNTLNFAMTGILTLVTFYVALHFTNFKSAKEMIAYNNDLAVATIRRYAFKEGV